MKYIIFSILIFSVHVLFADGKVVPRKYSPDHALYKASLEEYSQQAIIIMKQDEKGDVHEDLIIRIGVEGDHTDFAWIVPFPKPPEIFEEKSIIFEELFHYVKYMTYNRRPSKKSGEMKSEGTKNSEADSQLTVISRKTVGAFETAVVETKETDALNKWLKAEGYQELEDKANILKEYIDKKYVFACVKVKDVSNDEKRKELHPLRFSFKTGGKDGIYFPMKMTGLQEESFDINLYVFYRYWVNQRNNKFGYQKLGFEKRYRDYDTRACESNGGKNYGDPKSDPLLKQAAHLMPNVSEMFKRLYPDDRFYLTNIYTKDMSAETVRGWKDDLWLFPNYTDHSKVPMDVLNNGIASGFWPDESVSSGGSGSSAPNKFNILAIGVVVAFIAGLIVLMRFMRPKGDHRFS